MTTPGGLDTPATELLDTTPRLVTDSREEQQRSRRVAFALAVDHATSDHG
jgi:hypothetical protein